MESADAPERSEWAETARWAAAIVFSVPAVLLIFMNTAWWLDVMGSAMLGIREEPKAWVAVLALFLTLVPYGIGALAWWAFRRMGVKTLEGSYFTAVWPAGLVALVLAMPAYALL